MAYMNYAYTQFDHPAQLDDVSRLVATATPIAETGRTATPRSYERSPG